MSSKLYYWGTDIEVEIGDVVEVRICFKRHMGAVAYIPGVSFPKRDDMENDYGREWLIRLNRGDCLSMGYDLETPPGKYRKNIRFISRGEDPGMPAPEEAA